MTGASECVECTYSSSMRCPLRRRSSSVSLSSSFPVASSSLASSIHGSSATPCHANRLPFMSTTKSEG
eukprot:220622-Chlamydomonas_euryale.AAC.1